MSATDAPDSLCWGDALVVDIIDYFISDLTYMPMADVVISDGRFTVRDLVETRELAVTA